MPTKKMTSPPSPIVENDSADTAADPAHSKIGLSTDSDARRKPHGRGKKTSDCGDEVEFFVQIRDWHVTEIAFDAYGCNNTIACARVAQLAARGKTIRDALRDTTAQKIADELGFGPEQLHAAELVCEALADAIRAGIEVAKDPWKHAYSR